MQSAAARAAFDAELRRLPVAGLAAGVVRAGGERLFTATHAPLTDATVTRIASVTKTFTAIAVMQLVAHGRIGLDDPVNEHLTSFRLLHRDPDQPSVTIRHLLTHRAGLPEPLRWRELLGPSRLIGPRAGRPVPSLSDLYPAVLRPSEPAGHTWSYSNDGFAVLGQLVEDVTGVGLDKYLDEHVFAPVGMTRTTIAPDPTGSTPAGGHRLRPARPGRRHPHPRPVAQRAVVKAGAGAAFSTLTDLLAFSADLAAPDSSLLLPEPVLRAMWEPQVWLGDRVPFQALCWFLDEVAGEPVVFHAGDLPGYEAAVFIAPTSGVGVAVLANTSARGMCLRLGRRLLELALDDHQAPVTQSPASATTPPPATDDGASAAVGTYKLERGRRRNLRALVLTGGRVSVRASDAGLTMRGRFGPLRRGVALAPMGSDPLRFRFLLPGFPYQDVPVDTVFVRGSDERVNRLDLGLVGARLWRQD